VEKEIQKKIKVVLVRSQNGCNELQRRTVKGLGLGRMHSTSILNDTQAIRGMIRKVSHLVQVEIVR